MTKPSEVLLSIADVLSGNPDILTKGEMATDESGKISYALDYKSCKWCAMGLINVASNDLLVKKNKYFVTELYNKSYIFLYKAIGNKGISGWNDNRKTTAKDVTNAFYTAAELAKDAGE